MSLPVFHHVPGRCSLRVGHLCQLWQIHSYQNILRRPQITLNCLRSPERTWSHRMKCFWCWCWDFWMKGLVSLPYRRCCSKARTWSGSWILLNLRVLNLGVILYNLSSGLKCYSRYWKSLFPQRLYSALIGCCYLCRIFWIAVLQDGLFPRGTGFQCEGVHSAF